MGQQKGDESDYSVLSLNHCGLFPVFSLLIFKMIVLDQINSEALYSLYCTLFWDCGPW